MSSSTARFNRDLPQPGTGRRPSNPNSQAGSSLNINFAALSLQAQPDVEEKTATPEFKFEYEKVMYLARQYTNLIVQQIKLNKVTSTLIMRDADYLASNDAQNFMDLVNSATSLDKVYRALISLKNGMKKFITDNEKNKKYDSIKKNPTSEFVNHLDNAVLSKFKLELILACWARDVKPAAELNDLLIETNQASEEIDQENRMLTVRVRELQKALETEKLSSRVGLTNRMFPQQTSRKPADPIKDSRELEEALGVNRNEFIKQLVKANASADGSLADWVSQLIVDLSLDACENTLKPIKEIFDAYKLKVTDPNIQTQVAALESKLPKDSDPIKTHKEERMKTINKVIYSHEHIKLSKDAKQRLRKMIELLYELSAKSSKKVGH